jgi:hypothetical protein
MQSAVVHYDYTILLHEAILILKDFSKSAPNLGINASRQPDTVGSNSIDKHVMRWS